MSFRALVTDRLPDGELRSSLKMLTDDQLPAGDVLVSIEWAGLNYKDALCLTGQGGLVRNYPHVGGIDFAGRVVESSDARYHPGQAVILTGWRVGEIHWGGYAQRARVKADWLVPLPKRFSTRTAMMLGTAGLAAMLAVNRLQAEGVRAGEGEVLVTGAGGGVGSIAVLLLSRLGYEVAAVTGRAELGEQLTRLGASRIVSRDEVLTPTGKVLDKEQWSGAIDSVGGPLLGEVLKKVRYGGAVAAIGNAGGRNWDASVIPFILRNISLCGIDTVMQPFEARRSAWDRLTNLFVPAAFEPMLTEARLEDLPELAARMLEGKIAGRVVINPRNPPT
ncbi:MAG TPA: MDR family oxidoreductase [Devosia sp.]|jgi:acrylyl-CoA reductase (NADPH)|uniref:MDR family oxidoreductase n=1 Tax=Devosia sp. TaxID=1871048 RepID=UPI002DDD9F01|nr:MDR family oxidoreductase [Devosia sp.]HEV2514726.1 MDR family oxidoreductase [Devosia sp.]